jgi:hypothetical protein
MTMSQAENRERHLRSQARVSQLDTRQRDLQQLLFRERNRLMSEKRKKRHYRRLSFFLALLVAAYALGGLIGVLQ